MAGARRWPHEGRRGSGAPRSCRAPRPRGQGRRRCSPSSRPGSTARARLSRGRQGRGDGTVGRAPRRPTPTRRPCGRPPAVLLPMRRPRAGPSSGRRSAASGRERHRAGGSRGAGRRVRTIDTRSGRTSHPQLSTERTTLSARMRSVAVLGAGRLRARHAGIRPHRAAADPQAPRQGRARQGGRERT